MRAVLAKAGASLSRRKLQCAIITVVLLLSSCAGALSVSLVALIDEPFAVAFDQARGAHLSLEFDPAKVTMDQVGATASESVVSASAGPFRSVLAQFAPGDRARQNGTVGDVTLLATGRDRPDGTVDRIRVVGGRWATGPGQAVVAQRAAEAAGLQPGDVLTPRADSGLPPLRITGIAVGVGDPSDLWVPPDQVPPPAAGRARSGFWMFYRLHGAATQSDLAAAARSIGASVGPDAILGRTDWFETRKSADLVPSIIAPFLLAFSVIALAAAALIIVNVVAGAVIADYRDIGVMKSVGFTPGQVVATLLLQMLVPGALGALGVPLGVMLSQPIIGRAAYGFDLPPSLWVAPGIDAAVVAGMLLVVVLAASAPALRAGRTSAVTAISRGATPRAEATSGATRMLVGLPVPRALALGARALLARPSRSLLTLLTISAAVASVTFATGLVESLGMVATHLVRDQYAPIEVTPTTSADQDLATLIHAQPGTARFVSEGSADAYVRGILQPVGLRADGGDSSWLGFAVISGRWFRGPGEAVATTELLRQSRATVGDTLTVMVRDHRLRLRLVGSYVDESAAALLRTDSSGLAGAGVVVQPDLYEVALAPGRNARRYADQLVRAAPPGSIGVSVKRPSTRNPVYVAIDTILVWLALVVSLIGMMGVFNTVLLSTREKAREIAVLKAIGMAPRQAVSMALCSVGALALAGALVGLPLGVALHHRILATMLDIGAKSDVPSSFFDVFGPWRLAVLALVGVLVSLLGGWLPARWAARSSVTDVLRAE